MQTQSTSSNAQLLSMLMDMEILQFAMCFAPLEQEHKLASIHKSQQRFSSRTLSFNILLLNPTSHAGNMGDGKNTEVLMGLVHSS